MSELFIHGDHCNIPSYYRVERREKESTRERTRVGLSPPAAAGMAPSSGGPSNHGSTSRYCSVKEYATTKKVSFQRFTSSPSFGVKDGVLAIIFSEQDLACSARDFAFTAMLQFSSGRPSLPNLRQYLDAKHFSGDFVVGLLDSTTLMVLFDSETDLFCLLSKLTCFILSFPYWIFRWVARDDLRNGAFFTPIWITLPHLPLQFFHPDLLRPIASFFGTLLAMDLSTSSLARPSEARFCVELDLRSPPPSSVWIGSSAGFLQDVSYHRLPALVFGHLARGSPAAPIIRCAASAAALAPRSSDSDTLALGLRPLGSTG